MRIPEGHKDMWGWMLMLVWGHTQSINPHGMEEG